jgi:hypothetical protein
MKKLG